MAKVNRVRVTSAIHLEMSDEEAQYLAALLGKVECNVGSKFDSLYRALKEAGYGWPYAGQRNIHVTGTRPHGCGGLTIMWEEVMGEQN